MLNDYRKNDFVANVWTANLALFVYVSTLCLVIRYLINYIYLKMEENRLSSNDILMTVCPIYLLPLMLIFFKLTEFS